LGRPKGSQPGSDAMAIPPTLDSRWVPPVGGRPVQARLCLSYPHLLSAPKPSARCPGGEQEAGLCKPAGCRRRRASFYFFLVLRTANKQLLLCCCPLTDNGARRSSPPDDLKRSNKAGVAEGNGLAKLRHRGLGGKTFRFGSETLCTLVLSASP
jgi:hypothetical protein